MKGADMFRGLLGVVLIAGIAGIAGSLAGCRNSATPVPVKPSNQPVLATTFSEAGSDASGQPKTASAAVRRTLEDAHKEYLAAYERYVRMLRESGPQTMETLNALAEYQRKYQTWQLMLGNAKSSR